MTQPPAGHDALSLQPAAKNKRVIMAVRVDAMFALRGTSEGWYPLGCAAAT